MSDLKNYFKYIMGIILAFVIGTGAYDAFFYSLQGNHTDAMRALIAMEITVLLALGGVLILVVLDKTIKLPHNKTSDYKN